MTTVERLLAPMPMLWVLISLVAGIIVALVFPNYALIGAGVCVVAVIALFLLRRPVAALWLVLVAIGLVMTYLRQPIDVADLLNTPKALHLSGVVDNYKEGNYSQRFILNVDTVNGSKCAKFEVLTYFHSVVPPVEPGDRVKISAELLPAHQEQLVPDEFTMNEYCRRHSVSARCDIDAGELAIVSVGTGYDNRLFKIRRSFADAVMNSGVNRSTGEFIVAILSGDTDDLSDEVRSRFSAAGIAHVLALSGTHVVVIMFLLSLLFFPFRLVGRQKFETIGVLLALWTYVAFTGFLPSVTRAAFMATMVLVSHLLRRGANSMNSLFLAATIILLLNPMALLSPGFQMTFVAVASILMFAMPVTPFQRNVFTRTLWNWLVMCVAAVVGTMPLAAWYFHQVPVYFLLANIPVALLLPLIMIGSIIMMCLYALGVDVGWMCSLLDYTYGALDWFAQWVVSLRGSHVSSVYYPTWLMLPYYAALVALWVGINTRRKMWVVSALALLTVAIVGAFCRQPRYPHMEVYQVDYYYSTVYLVKEGDRAVVLTDSPPKFYDRVVGSLETRLSDYMARRNIKSLDVYSDLIGLKSVRIGDNYWQIADKMVAIARKDTDLAKMPHRPDVLLISRGFNGDLKKVVEILEPDSVIVSKAVYYKQRELLSHELEAMRKPR